MENERLKSSETERLHPNDNVRVEIENVNGDVVTTYKGSGFSTIDEAINAAYNANPVLLGDMADYVYCVTNRETGVTRRYRINAGGNAKLII